MPSARLLLGPFPKPRPTFLFLRAGEPKPAPPFLSLALSAGGPACRLPSSSARHRAGLLLRVRLQRTQRRRPLLKLLHLGTIKGTNRVLLFAPPISPKTLNPPPWIHLGCVAIAKQPRTPEASSPAKFVVVSPYLFKPPPSPGSHHRGLHLDAFAFARGSLLRRFRFRPTNRSSSIFPIYLSR